ncbi:lysophospholipid acyltransferase family protein [Granulicella paludicola]|uniref:lysophospholipid acyltransferase family protein n=1 Tax=Granulicella paludicola TaxID=474951 RepID=UPI0021DFD27A|nr:lysophospholipid acyltransferase family protein [Granulicella paludicola]
MARELPAVPPISAAILRLFRRIVRGYFRRHFRAVLMQNRSYLSATEGPLIIYANHSSWWDPMVCILLGELLLPSHNHYAPMDAAALAKYPILKRLGIFPVEMQSPRGAAQFLRTSEAVLASGGVLWITPQGRFADPRAALEFKPGLGALATRVPGLQLQPLAIEYVFWDERLPETLLRFGNPLQVADGATLEQATKQLEDSLAATMEDLKASAVARDPRAFATLLQGGRGTGGIYALGRRLRALFTRKPIELDHTAREDRSPR